MRAWLLILSALCLPLLILAAAKSASMSDPGIRVFTARGVVVGLEPANHIVIIRHSAITNYMGAMTMPFKVRDAAELKGLEPGSEINFELHVGADESWVANLIATGIVTPPPTSANIAAASISPARNRLLRYAFTNELGQAVTLSDFPGQALAITFFYTRCPLPDYCPRLSKNFARASHYLLSLPNAPPNWLFISVSFDPEFDSPAVLRSYGQLYNYDPSHWSFFTGPTDKIRALARNCGVTMENIDGTINHNFRTLIIDASGHLQTVFPTGGDLSSEIASEIIKESAMTNASLARASQR